MGCLPPGVIFSHMYHEIVSQMSVKMPYMNGMVNTKGNYFLSENQSRLINKHRLVFFLSDVLGEFFS